MKTSKKINLVLGSVLAVESLLLGYQFSNTPVGSFFSNYVFFEIDDVEQHICKGESGQNYMYFTINHKSLMGLENQIEVVFNEINSNSTRKTVINGAYDKETERIVGRYQTLKKEGDGPCAKYVPL